MRTYTQEEKKRKIEWNRQARRNLILMKTIDDLNSRLDMRCFTIVHDPVPTDDGGFAPGAKIESDSIKIMAKIGSLSIGTIVESKMGSRYVVKNSNAKGFQGRLILIRSRNEYHKS